MTILSDILESGESGVCPCCEQTVKLYMRALTSVMATQLILMYHRNDYVHYKELRHMKGGDADYAKLRYWGLAEQGDVGWWKITPKGRMFVKGDIAVPSKAAVYNNTLYAFSKDTINIKDALDTKFNYEELMTPVPLNALDLDI